MSITVPNQTRDLIPGGNYVARCYSMIHIGTIPTSFGNETKLQNKVIIAWELPTVTYEYEGEEIAQVISKEYTLTMGSKGNLRKDLESWRGRAFSEAEAEDFDLTKLLGVPCMLNLIHKTSQTTGQTYVMISSVSTLPKGLECPPATRDLFEFNFDEKFSIENLDAMPEFVRNKVKMSQEYMTKMGLDAAKASIETAPVENNHQEEDDLPF